MTVKYMYICNCCLHVVNVVEVAHDNCAQVKNYVERDLKLFNSYDTWHGKMIKICFVTVMNIILTCRL